jgi:hypothetical protein
MLFISAAQAGVLTLERNIAPPCRNSLGAGDEGQTFADKTKSRGTGKGKNPLAG